VHAHHGLVNRAERVGEVKLGHHHAFEHVRRFADHDGIDIAKAETGILEGAESRFAHQPGNRKIVAFGGMLGLANADDGAGIHRSASRTQTKFC
jgi:hypothetical protein